MDVAQKMVEASTAASTTHTAMEYNLRVCKELAQELGLQPKDKLLEEVRDDTLKNLGVDMYGHEFLMGMAFASVTLNTLRTALDVTDITTALSALAHAMGTLAALSDGAEVPATNVLHNFSLAA